MVKGTIVITDPGYLNAFALMKSPTLYGDWSCMVYPGNIEEDTKADEWTKHYFDFFNKYNFSGLNSEEKANLSKEWKNFKESWIKENNVLGEFCADGGEVGVFLYNSLTKEDIKFIEEHPWCVTVIKDFEGDVDIININKSIHVIGKGNKPFYSVQSGL